jgi:TonB family protein
LKAIAFSIAPLFLAVLLQAVSSSGQTAKPSAPEPLKIDAVTGFIHLLSKPELAYPKEALQQHIEGKVELELTVSPQGDVVSERVVWGPSALQQATMEVFKKLKYIPFLRDGQPSVALVQAIVAYENDHAVMSTESDHATQNVIKVCSDKNPQPCATPPHPVKSPPPEYSAEAREAKIEGAVVLGTVVGVDGNARDIRVVQSLGHGLDEKAIEAVKKWKFEPGTNAGVPVAVLMNVEMDFHLR